MSHGRMTDDEIMSKCKMSHQTENKYNCIKLLTETYGCVYLIHKLAGELKLSIRHKQHLNTLEASFKNTLQSINKGISNTHKNAGDIDCSYPYLKT